MADIISESHSDEIERLLGKHALVPDTVLYVDDIQAWCLEHGLEEHNPWRAAKTVYHKAEAPARILIARTITRDMVESIAGSLKLNGFGEADGLLENDLRFLRHLILHEVRHVLDRAAKERDCDEWAFEELRREEAPARTSEHLSGQTS